MAEVRERLSSVLKNTQRFLATLSDKELAPLRAAFKEAFSPAGSRTLESGAKVDGVNVDISPVLAAAKPGSDAANALREVFRATLSEAAYRGENWAREGLHLALKEHLPALSSPAADAAAK
jgi:hypothetical protein